MQNFNSKIIDDTTKASEVTYPRLMQDIDSLSVYLMTGFSSGTKVAQGKTMMNSCYPVGCYRTDWYGPDMRDFKGDVLLSGKAV